MRRRKKHHTETPMQQAIDKTPDQPHLSLIKDIKVDPIFILGDHSSGADLLYKALTKTNRFNAVNAYHIISYSQLLSNHIQQREPRAIQTLAKQLKPLEKSPKAYAYKLDSTPATPESPEEYGFILKNIAGDHPKITLDNLSIFQQLCQKAQYISSSPKPLLLNNPWDYSQFQQVQQLIPKARFIFIHRYPIHIINDQLKAARLILSSKNKYMALLSRDYREIFQHPIKRSLLRFLYSNYFNSGVRQVSDAAIIAANNFIENIETLSKPTYCSIKYETFCQSPAETIQHILSFLEIEPESEINNKPYSHKKIELLPEVKKQRDSICQRLRPYLTYHANLSTNLAARSPTS